jgi:hypothetical protein
VIIDDFLERTNDDESVAGHLARQRASDGLEVRRSIGRRYAHQH